MRGGKHSTGLPSHLDQKSILLLLNTWEPQQPNHGKRENSMASSLSLTTNIQSGLAPL